MSNFDPDSQAAQQLASMLSGLFEDTLDGMLAAYARSKQVHEHTGEVIGVDEAWGQLTQLPEPLWPAFILHLVARIYDLQQQLEGCCGNTQG